ncbi:Uncharacterised protein [Mycobacterium tuberculosis]|nr:Uncharacterised protein [Mycobacterium tuberculosis]
MLCPTGKTPPGGNAWAPRGSISSTFLPRMVSVRMARRLSVPMVLVPMENLTTMWSPSILSPSTVPTPKPAMRTLSPLCSPPESVNWP